MGGNEFEECEQDVTCLMPTDDEVGEKCMPMWEDGKQVLFYNPDMYSCHRGTAETETTKYGKKYNQGLEDAKVSATLKIEPREKPSPECVAAVAEGDKLPASSHAIVAASDYDPECTDDCALPPWQELVCDPELTEETVQEVTAYIFKAASICPEWCSGNIYVPGSVDHDIESYGTCMPKDFMGGMKHQIEDITHYEASGTNGRFKADNNWKGRLCDMVTAMMAGYTDGVSHDVLMQTRADNATIDKAETEAASNDETAEAAKLGEEADKQAADYHASVVVQTEKAASDEADAAKKMEESSATAEANEKKLADATAELEKLEEEAEELHGEDLKKTEARIAEEKETVEQLKSDMEQAVQDGIDAANAEAKAESDKVAAITEAADKYKEESDAITAANETANKKFEEEAAEWADKIHSNETANADKAAAQDALLKAEAEQNEADAKAKQDEITAKYDEKDKAAADAEATYQEEKKLEEEAVATDRAEKKAAVEAKAEQVKQEYAAKMAEAKEEADEADEATAEYEGALEASEEKQKEIDAATEHAAALGNEFEECEQDVTCLMPTDDEVGEKCMPMWEDGKQVLFYNPDMYSCHRGTAETETTKYGKKYNQGLEDAKVSATLKIEPREKPSPECVAAVAEGDKLPASSHAIVAASDYDPECTDDCALPPWQELVCDPELTEETVQEVTAYIF